MGLMSALGQSGHQRDPSWTIVALGLANDAPVQELATQTA